MSRVMTLTVSSSLVTALMMAGGCGGDDALTTTSTFAAQGSIDATAPTTAPPTTASPTSPPSSTASTAPSTTVIYIEDATPWAVDLAEPTGLRLDGWMDAEPIVPQVGEPPVGIDAQLTWLYADLIERWRGDPRLVAFGMSAPVFERPHRETAPGAMIDVLGAAAAFLRDSQAVVAAHAEAVAGPEQPGAPMFATWAEFSAGWAEAAEVMRLAMVAARDLDPVDQECLLAAIAGDDDCVGPGAEFALELDAALGAMPAGDVEIDEPGSYAAAGMEFDECRAWDAAVEATGLTADDELRIWVALDDSDLDRFVLSLSECGWVADRVEDPEADGDADEEVYLAYLAEIAAAIVESGYDETVADFGGGAEDERRYYEAMSANTVEHVLNTARDAASRRWSQMWSLDAAVKLYAVSGFEIDDWVELDDLELDWDDLGTRICAAWESVVADYDDAEQTAIAAAVSELGFRNTIIPAAC